MAKLGLDVNSDFLHNAFTLAHLSQAAYDDAPDADASFGKTVFDDAETFSTESTFGFVTSNKDHVVLAFRGTDDVKDWISNLTISVVKVPGGGKVHQGFAELLDSIWDPVMKKLEKRWAGQQTFWITGHSLGGALATLATKRLPQGWKPFATHTFGQPRVGEQKFAGNYRFNHFRFVNNDDLVPTLPPRIVPVAFPPAFYTHVGNLEFFNDKGKLSARPGDELGVLPSLVETLSSVSDREDEAHDIIVDGIKDHKMTNYIKCLEMNLP